jgi:hypothetical protein
MASALHGMLLWQEANRPGGIVFSSTDFFAGSQWNAVGGIGKGRCSSAALPASGWAADAQKRVPTTKSQHLREGLFPVR